MKPTELKTDKIEKIANLENQKKLLDKKIKELKMELTGLAPSEGSIKYQDPVGNTATITVAETISYKDEIAELCENHKSIAKEYFKMVWKPVCNKAIERKIESSTSPVWQEVKALRVIKKQVRIAVKSAK